MVSSPRPFPPAIRWIPLIALMMPAFLGGAPSRRADDDRGRIQRDLARVERELVTRDVSALSQEQKRARDLQIAHLRTYRQTGVFPHNHDFPGQRVPYFVDEHGTLCAMAYLIATSGREDIVRQVSMRRNNAKVTELAADPALGPALAAWLEGAGLTVAEAQRIQPAYGYWEVVPEDSHVTRAFVASSAALGALNVVAIGVNGSRVESSRRAGWTAPLGVGVGAGQTVFGIVNWNRRGSRGALGVVNATVGVLSVLVSGVAWVRPSRSRPAFANAEPATPALRPGLWMDRGLNPMVGAQAVF